MKAGLKKHGLLDKRDPFLPQSDPIKRCPAQGLQQHLPKFPQRRVRQLQRLSRTATAQSDQPLQQLGVAHTLFLQDFRDETVGQRCQPDHLTPRDDRGQL